MPTTVCRACGGAGSPLRWACPCCVRATVERLDGIRDHAVALCAAGPSHEGRSDPTPPVPARLRSALEEGLRDPDPAVVALSVLAVLHRVATYVRHHRGDPGAWRCTIVGETGYLRANAEWCAHQLWGHEFVEVVHELHVRIGSRSASAVR
ncbi:hypothetical protein [Umezawaea sp. Da 62-37]|uniref:hypothetical protein n=1 Tax=Umezawaea sp. Da 62-37 TaxID=3075927 RepID=UPI0028F70B77|nr:hypothetical protein [Umezawaea sp. Da 62-37]WNV86466.1 hypothetical protein RM788_51545 [Umezawaea sp. Da 62-37]